MEEAKRAGVRLGVDPVLSLMLKTLGKEEEDKIHTPFYKNPFGMVYLGWQFVFIILFAIFAQYGHSAAGGDPEEGAEVVTRYYPFYTDVHGKNFLQLLIFASHDLHWVRLFDDFLEKIRLH